MARYPILPLYTDAYLGDTMHLSLEEHGAYLKLLMIMWRSEHCRIADSDRDIARMLGVNVKRWRERIRPRIEHFFDHDSGHFLIQKRLKKERGKCEKRSAVARANALKSLETRSAKAPATAEQTHQQNASYPYPYPEKRESPPIKSPPANSGPKIAKGNGHDKQARGTRLPPDWQPDDDDIAFAAALGLDPADTAARFRDYWHDKPGANGRKLRWTATWRNWCRRAADSRRPRPRDQGIMVAAARIARRLDSE